MSRKSTKQLPITEVCRPSLNFSEIALNSTNQDELLKYVRSKRGLQCANNDLFPTIVTDKPRKSFKFELVQSEKDKNEVSADTAIRAIPIPSTEVSNNDQPESDTSKITSKCRVPRVLLKNMKQLPSEQPNNRLPCRQLLTEFDNTAENQNEFIPRVFSTPNCVDADYHPITEDSPLSPIRNSHCAASLSKKKIKNTTGLNYIKEPTKDEIEVARKIEILLQKQLEDMENDESETLINSLSKKSQNQLEHTVDKTLTKSKVQNNIEISEKSTRSLKNIENPKETCIETNQNATVSKSIRVTQSNMLKSMHKTLSDDIQVPSFSNRTTNTSIDKNIVMDNVLNIHKDSTLIINNFSEIKPKSSIVGLSVSADDNSSEKVLNATYKNLEIIPENLQQPVNTTNIYIQTSIINQSDEDEDENCNQDHQHLQIENIPSPAYKTPPKIINQSKNYTNSSNIHTIKSKLTNSKKDATLNLNEIKETNNTGIRAHVVSNILIRPLTDNNGETPDAINELEQNPSPIRYMLSKPIDHEIFTSQDGVEPFLIVEPPLAFSDIDISSAKIYKKSISNTIVSDIDSGGNMQIHTNKKNKTNFERVDMIITRHEDSSSGTDTDTESFSNNNNINKTRNSVKPINKSKLEELIVPENSLRQSDKFQPKNYEIQAIDLRTKRSFLKRHSETLEAQAQQDIIDDDDDDNDDEQHFEELINQKFKSTHPNTNKYSLKNNNLQPMLTPRYTPPPPIEFECNDNNAIQSHFLVSMQQNDNNTKLLKNSSKHTTTDTINYINSADNIEYIETEKAKQNISINQNQYENLKSNDKHLEYPNENIKLIRKQHNPNKFKNQQHSIQSDFIAENQSENASRTYQPVTHFWNDNEQNEPFLINPPSVEFRDNENVSQSQSENNQNNITRYSLRKKSTNLTNNFNSIINDVKENNQNKGKTKSKVNRSLSIQNKKSKNICESSSSENCKDDNNLLPQRDIAAEYGYVFDDEEKGTALWRKSILNKPKCDKNIKRQKKDAGSTENVLLSQYIEIGNKLNNNNISTVSGRRNLYSKGQSDDNDSINNESKITRSKKSNINRPERTVSSHKKRLSLSTNQQTNNESIHHQNSDVNHKENGFSSADSGCPQTFLSPKLNLSKNIINTHDEIFKKPFLPTLSSKDKSKNPKLSNKINTKTNQNEENEFSNTNQSVEPILSQYFGNGTNSDLDSMRRFGSPRRTSTKLVANYEDNLTANVTENNTTTIPAKQKKKNVKRAPKEIVITENNVTTVDNNSENNFTSLRRSARKPCPVKPIWTTASLSQLLYDSNFPFNTNKVTKSKNNNNKKKKDIVRKKKDTQLRDINLYEITPTIHEEAETNFSDLNPNPAVVSSNNQHLEKSPERQNKKPEKQVKKNTQKTTSKIPSKKSKNIDENNDPNGIVESQQFVEENNDEQISGSSLVRTKTNNADGSQQTPQFSRVPMDSENVNDMIQSNSSKLFDWLRNYTTGNAINSTGSTDATTTSSNKISKIVLTENFSVVPFESMTTSERNGVEYAFYNVLDTSQHFGYMKFQPKSYKTRSRSKRTNLNFILLCGTVEFTIEYEILVLKQSGSAVLIPHNTRYGIKNDSSENALLWFHKS